MSQISSSTAPSTDLEEIFRTSLQAYKKKTKTDIPSHPLATQLQSCASPGDILNLLQAQAKAFDKSQPADGNLTKWLDPTVNVLCKFSAILGNGVGLVFPPANAIFTGIGVLLQGVKDVRPSQDALVEIFDRIECFFKRLELHIEARPTAAMKDVIVKIMVEVLSILGILTKEIGQGRMKKLLKGLAGIKDVEDALARLDNLTQEEAQMAQAEILKTGHEIFDGMGDVNEKLEGVHKDTHGISTKLEGLDVEVQDVSDKVQDIKNKICSADENAKKNEVVAQQSMNKVNNLHLHDERQSLKNWISPPNISVNHTAACDAQCEGTATWCTQGTPVFAKWKASGSFEDSLLWIHGKPGSGKSVLSSAIIESLPKPSSGSVAYFYFDFRDVGKQDSRALLSSLVFQLSDQSERFYDILRGLYSEHRNGSEKPNNDSLLRCLKVMVANTGPEPIYLVMDALDECPNNVGVPSPRDKVLDLVKELVELRLPNLRLCVTSRSERDICTALEPLKPHQISLHDESGQTRDIRDYVTHIVGSDRQMKIWPDKEKNLVIDVLSEKAGGMFRWVICQLAVLRTSATVDVPRTLENLPKSLDETYERILEGINKVNWEYAYRLLQCLTVAVRPLRVEELAEALVVEFNPGEIPTVNEDWRWEIQEEVVLSACSSLVEVITDEGSQIIQFAHFSVKEFLISDRLANSQFHIPLAPANATFSQACLYVLLQLDDQANEESKSVPLVRYAAEYWVKHAQNANEELGITDTMYYFLDMDKPHFSAWVRIQGLNDLLRFSASEKQPKTVPPPAAPLYFAAESGFRGLVERMVDNVKHSAYLNTWGGVYGTPLHASVLGGHLGVAQFLAARGADIEACSADKWTPLHLASQEGHIDIGKWLLDKRVKVDPRQAKDWTPLHMAMPNGRLELAQILLEHGAKPNTRDRDGRTPLHYASWKGHLDVVRLLLDRGADARILDNNEYSPLYFSMTSRQLDVARLLLKHKADANARDELGRTFVHCASAQGHDDVVLFFLELGAEVDACDKDGNTPLHLAASNGNLEVSRILLEHKAEVNARNDDGSTPLHKASDGDPGTVQLLLDWNADMYARDNDGCTPMRIATATQSEEVTQRIWEHAMKTPRSN